MKEEESLDEEELVRQVVEENPVAERGTRDEWVQHEGWHRREDVHSLRSSQTRDQRNDGNSTSYARLGNSQAIRDDSRSFWLLCPLLILLSLLALVTRIRQGHKTRTV